MKRHLLEALTLIAAAILCALAANALATKERKVNLVVADVGRAKSPPPQGATTATTVPSVAAGSQPAIVPPVATSPPAEIGRAKSPPPQKVTPAPPQKVDLSKFKPHEQQAYIEIHGDDVAALHDAGALFLDARRTSVYEQGHIAGARPISVWDADKGDKVNALFSERSDPSEQNLPIVIYCSGGDCEDSHMLAQKLWGVQFNNVYVYKDGYPDWVAHRGAAHTGSNP